MSKKILVVDGSRVERTVLSGFLKKDYEILEATSGTEAIREIRENYNSLSAVILDVIMPDMDGYEALKKIKSNPLWQQLPVIVTTGLDEDDSREQAIINGADNFITKPYNQALLLYVVQNVIKLRETAAIANSLLRDSLTGLLSHNSFFAEAQRMISRHEEGYYILSCLDVDNFKVINDQYGTEIGDKVLKHIANCLSGFVAGINGLTCRYMADKFAILYPAAVKDTPNLKENHRKTMMVSCISSAIRTRIGRYLVNDLTIPISMMFDRASMAQESIKDRYDEYIADYTDSMRLRIIKEQKIVNSMTDALKKGEFEPWLQPQYNHATGALIGAEALVRWNMNGCYISPADFIPVFERNGFIYAMDQCVCEQVCALLRRWLDEGKNPLPVSINISRKDLFHKHFIQVLTGIVNKYNLPYDLIRLEVTESAFADSSIVKKVVELIHLGFTVEIDDFGSGYSSLNTLKDVPASILKLDMKFFENTKNQERGGNIIESVVRMAKWLGMSVIAEGVEEKSQADYLKSIGCYYIQGYYYAKPMSAEKFEQLLDTDNKNPKLDALKTLETLDNNEFWNPKSIETLIFNSYVGGACIFEYHDGKSEILRMNEQYTKEMGGLIPAGTRLADASIVKLMTKEEREKVRETIIKAIETLSEASCEVCISDGKQKEYIRITNRIIARAGDRYLCYCIILNITADREASAQLKFLNETAHDILSESDSNIVIYGILRKILQYFNGQRAYIMEDDASGEWTNNTYEVCADGVLSVKYKRQKLCNGMSGCRNENYVLIKDVKNFAQANIAFLNMLSGQGVNSTIIVPLIYNGRIFGSIGIDNPQTAWNGIERLKAIGDYAAMLLVRRDEMANISNAQAMITSLMDDTPGGFVRMKLVDGQFFVPVYANDGFRKMLGMSHEALMNIYGSNVLDGVHPEDREIVSAVGEKMLSNGQAESARFRLCNGNGDYIWITLYGRTTKDTAGDTYLNVYYTDVTDEVNEEERQKELLDNLPCGVALYEYDRKHLFAIHINKRYWELVDRESANYSDISLFDMIHPDDRMYVREEMDNAIRENRNISVDFRVQTGDKTYKAFHVAANVSYTGDGKYKFYATYTPILEKVMAFPEAYQTTAAIQEKIQSRIRRVKNADQKAVLVIDDNLLERTVLSEYLKSEFDIISAGSGEEAIAILKENSEHISAIVLDILMPKMDGYTVMKNLRGTVAFANIPIIVSTGLEDDETREKAIAYGANGFITKPYNRTLLLHAVHNAVQLRDIAVITEQMRVEQQQKKLLDNLPSGAALYEYDGKTITAVHINKTYWKLVGREPIDDTKVSVFDAVFPEDAAIIKKEIHSAIFLKRDVHLDIRILHGSGEYRLFHVNASIVQEKNGLNILFASYEPITEQEKLLQQMNFELNTLLYTIPSGVFKYSADEKEEFAYINRNFVESLGYTEESFKEKFHNCFREMIYAPDREEAEHQILIQEGDGGIGKFDYRVPAFDGTLHWFHDEGVKVTDENGKEWYYVTLVDITEQKETEKNLRLAEEEYRVATRHSGHTIGRYDIAKETLFITENAEKRLDLPEIIPDVPYGRVKLGKISPETADAYVAFYENIMNGKKEGSVTFQKLLSSGWRWITEHATTIFDENGKPISAIISCADVTEHREKEIAFKKWQQELENKRNDTFTLYRINLNKNSSYDSVDGTLLNFTTNDDETIPLNERMKDFAMQCVVEEDRERFLSFVNADVLLANYYRGKRTAITEFRARLSNSKVHWIRLTVDLVEYPNSSDVEAYLMYDDINDSKVIELTTRKQAQTDALTGLLNRKTFSEKLNEIITLKARNGLSALLLIDMDGFKLVNDHFGHSVGDQVLIDAGKAIRSIVYGGDLVCRLGGDEFIVCVRDMPNRNMILKKAKQICELTRRSFSFGIQLTVSLGISVFPEDGDTFDTLYQKADKALYQVKGTGKNNCAFYDESMEESSVDSVLPMIVNSVTNKNRMLIVDDNKGSRLYLEAIFKNEFIVECVDNGEAALACLQKYGNQVAICLLDLMMPDMSGFEVLDKMHENKETELIPVIIVSGIDDRETNLRALRRGAFDFVSKPVDPDLLRIRVSSAIERTEIEYLRMQNEFLSIQRDEMNKIRKILEDDGTVIVEYEIGSGLFRYDSFISEVLGGKFDTRPLWDIFAQDRITEKGDAEKLKDSISVLKKSKGEKSVNTVMKLKTNTGSVHSFRVKVMRCDNDILLENKILLTFTDIDM